MPQHFTFLIAPTAQAQNCWPTPHPSWMCFTDGRRPCQSVPASITCSYRRRAGIEQLTWCWPGHVDRSAPDTRSAAGKTGKGTATQRWPLAPPVAPGIGRGSNPPFRSSADLLANTSPSPGYASPAIAGRVDRHRPRSPAAVAGAAGIEQLTRCWPAHVDRRAPGARSAAGKSRAGHGHRAVATGAAGTCRSTDHPRTPPPARGSPGPSPNTSRGFVDDSQHRPPPAAKPIPPPFPPGRERVGL
ncbi:hypothetical protein QFZ38_005538 [Pseudomonas cedrina]|nr:hypothetical protein [Pseudomonas cedrina]